MVEDRLILSELRLRGRHGVDPSEREQPQEFRVEIECPTDARRAGGADELAETLDYRRLRDVAAAVIEGPPRQLVETLTEEIASRVLRDLECDWVRVKVTKLRPGAIEGHASIEVRRHRTTPEAAYPRAPLELHVPSFAPVKEFYGRLGFETLREEPGDDGYLIMRFGTNVLAFWPGSETVFAHPYFGSLDRATKRGYGVEVIITVDDVDALYERARAFAKIVEPLQRRSWGPRDFRVEDPFGYYLRLTER